MPASLLDPDYQFGASPLPQGAPTDLLGQPLQVQAAPPQDASTDLGAGLAQTYQDVSDYISRQREQSRQMGLLGDDGLPTGAGVVDAARQTAQGVMMGTTAPGDVPPPGILAYHGSPHSFDQFDTSKIGTGEGAQAYGHGLYFAEKEGVARSYKEGLSPRVGPDHFALMDALEQNAGLGMPEISGIATAQNPRAAAGEYLDYLNRAASRNPDLAAKRDALTAYMPSIPEQRLSPPGSMYQVNIGADPEHFLDWDKPLSEQSQHVQEALGKVSWAEPYLQSGKFPGSQIAPNTPEGAQQLRDAGVAGIKYLDQGSRGAGQGSHNYVVFDANTIDILRKYGIAGLMLGGGAAATQRQGNSQ